MQRRIDAPRYLIDQPVRDVRQIYPEEGASELGTDILGDWPSQPCILDDSQLAALKRIMTKSLAIVQVTIPENVSQSWRADSLRRALLVLARHLCPSQL